MPNRENVYEENEEEKITRKVSFRDDSDRPLSPNERAGLRDLLQADQRRIWIISLVKQVSLWIIAVSAAFAIFHDTIRDFFKAH